MPTITPSNNTLEIYAVIMHKSGRGRRVVQSNWILPVLELVQNHLTSKQLAFQLTGMAVLIGCQLPNHPAVVVGQPCICSNALVCASIKQGSQEILWTYFLPTTVLVSDTTRALSEIPAEAFDAWLLHVPDKVMPDELSRRL